MASGDGPMTLFSFSIQGLPKMTNPSGAKSTHWRVRKAESDKWKKWVCAAINAGRKFKEWPLEKANLTLIRHSSSRPDPDGLVSGFKAVIDGLVVAGVLKNDKFKNIGMPNYMWQPAAPKKGFITVLVSWDDSCIK